MKNEKKFTKITEVLGSNCLSLYITRPKFFHETTLIVIDKYPFSSVQKIKEVLLSEKIRYILLTRKEIEDSTDVFPLHFLSLKKTRKHIFGEDIFAQIEIEKSDIRRKLEYDFRNKNIYLRQEAINIPAKEIIQNILPELFPAFCSLAHILSLQWESEKYSPDEYKKLLQILNSHAELKIEKKMFSVFLTFLDENIENWTQEKSLDILKKVSIELENIADFVNNL